jgi:hypothetical protein
VETRTVLLEEEARALRYYKLKDFHIEISPNELAGIWIGNAIIVATLSYFGDYAGFSVIIIILALMLTGSIMKQDPGGVMGVEMKAKMENMGERLSALERKVDEINRLLEE